ncbi:MAG: hypothetical protein ACI8ZM_004812 [Crocinitomix sp.]|jgi:hypothetical protein
MNILDKLLNQLETKISNSEALNQAVSQAAVAWHLEHIFLTIDATSDFILKSDPKDYKWKFNFTKIVIFTIKKIPRGRGKAPKVVRPKEMLSENSLRICLEATRNKIKELETISKGAYFPHPIFGNLKLKESIFFLGIHTKHHLAIIDDIINSKRT